MSDEKLSAILTVGDLKNVLAQLPDHMWVIANGHGPVNHLHVEPGANEPHIVLWSIHHLENALILIPGGKGGILQDPEAHAGCSLCGGRYDAHLGEVVHNPGCPATGCLCGEDHEPQVYRPTPVVEMFPEPTPA